MIFQHFNLVNRLTVMQNIMHGRLGYMSSIDGVLGRYSEEDKQHALDLLEEIGLSEFAYRRASELSGGQKQRVGIVRAIMQNPALLLCDEPIASLDPANSRVIMDLIRSLAKQHNIGCLVNLHQVEVALEFSDRIIGMKQGRIVYDGPAEALSENEIEHIYDKPMHLLTIRSEVALAE
jgi:phosphonate transport system ATP-binding protein